MDFSLFLPPLNATAQDDGFQDLMVPKLNSSDLGLDEEKLENMHFVLSLMIVPIAKQKATLLSAMWNLEPLKLTEKEWNDCLAKLKSVVKEMVEVSCRNALAEELMYSSSGELLALSDCCWLIRGFSSPCGAVSFMGGYTFKIIDIEVLINRGSAKNINVTSRAFEGEGTSSICSRLLKKGYQVGVFLHDGDAGS